MDYFKYITVDPNDHHERELLRELNDFSLVQFTQKSWFDREMKTVGKEIKYLDGRKNQEKYVKKRANVLASFSNPVLVYSLKFSEYFFGPYFLPLVVWTRPFVIMNLVVAVAGHWAKYIQPVTCLTS